MRPGTSRIVDFRVIIVLIMLLGATWSDLLTRRVRNQYWMPFIVVAAMLWVMQAWTDPVEVLWPAIYAGIATAGLYGMWALGFFGGADAKGLMVVAWLWSGEPDLFASATIPVLDTLVNGTFLMLALPLAFFLFNLLRGHIHFPAMFLGTQMETQTARKRWVWPLQRVQDGQMAWKYWQRPTEGLDAAYAALARHGIERVWVTPKVPFMLPLSLGVVLTALFGNVMLWLMAQAL